MRVERDTDFTLLEVMIALAILAIFIGIGAPRLIESIGRAKSQAAEMQMINLKGALHMFTIDTGRHPSEAEGLDALVRKPAGTRDWRGPDLDSADDINDPWGRRTLYRCPVRAAASTFSHTAATGGGGAEDSDIRPRRESRSNLAWWPAENLSSGQKTLRMSPFNLVLILT